jgi:hypothetical protein
MKEPKTNTERKTDTIREYQVTQDECHYYTVTLSRQYSTALVTYPCDPLRQSLILSQQNTRVWTGYGTYSSLRFAKATHPGTIGGT